MAKGIGKKSGRTGAQAPQFDYYRGMEAGQYTFYRIPKALFTEECFKALSCEAKVLYGLLLDRMGLSIKNRWIDEEDRVYIVFTVEDVMEMLNCSRQKAVKNLAELDSEKGIGLIEKKRLGLGKPNVIYVKNFIIKEGTEGEEKTPENAQNTQKYENHTSRSMKNELQEVPKPYFKEYENHISGSMKNELQEVPKSYSNNTDINNTEFSDTEFNDTEFSRIRSHPISSHPSIPAPALDVDGGMNAYRGMIRGRISYGCFRDWGQRESVDELVELMAEVMSLPDDGAVRIAGADKPAAAVKRRFMQLEYDHIEYILECLGASATKVGNIKAYLLTALYNAPMTINNYYMAQVGREKIGGTL